MSSLTLALKLKYVVVLFLSVDCQTKLKDLHWEFRTKGNGDNHKINKHKIKLKMDKEEMENCEI